MFYVNWNDENALKHFPSSMMIHSAFLLILNWVDDISDTNWCYRFILFCRWCGIASWSTSSELDEFMSYKVKFILMRASRQAGLLKETFVRQVFIVLFATFKASSWGLSCFVFLKQGVGQPDKFMKITCVFSLFRWTGLSFGVFFCWRHLHRILGNSLICERIKRASYDEQLFPVFLTTMKTHSSPW
jgi:hypothetical protein